MSVRSKRLWGPLTVGAGPTVVYTAAAGETVLIKQVALSNPAALAQTAALYINGNAAANIVGGVTISPGQVATLTGLFYVLQPGDTLRVGYSGTGGASSGYGAELEGVAG